MRYQLPRGWYRTFWSMASFCNANNSPWKDGEEFALIFGDSFTGDGFGQDEWASPAGMIARVENGEVVMAHPLNEGDDVEQLVK